MRAAPPEMKIQKMQMAAAFCWIFRSFIRYFAGVFTF
jgi:hypothetical protein